MLNVQSKIRTFDLSVVPSLKKVLNTALQILNQHCENLKFNLYIVSKDFIHNLNFTERGVDKATDVLSFPNINVKAGEIIGINNYKLDVDYEDNSLLIGEIFICNDIAKKQAVKYGHSYTREICFLFLHGILHCLGYDHIKDADRIIMERLQTEILNKCDITRD